MLDIDMCDFYRPSTKQYAVIALKLTLTNLTASLTVIDYVSLAMQPSQCCKCLR